MEEIRRVTIEKMICSSACRCDRGDRSARAVKIGTTNPAGNYCIQLNCKKLKWEIEKAFLLGEGSIFSRVRLICTDYIHECKDGAFTGEYPLGASNTPTEKCLFCNHLRVA